MADEINIGAGQGAPPEGAKNTAHEDMIPRARLNEVIAERNTVRDQLEKLEKAQREADEKRLADQQQWQQLYEAEKAKVAQLEPLKTQFESVNATLDSLLDAQLEALPDDMRDMVRELPVDVQGKLDWLAKNKARLMRPTAPDMDAGARGDTRNKDAELTPEELQMARMMGMDVADYSAFKARRAKSQDQQQAPSWMQNLGFRSKGD